ncbi:NADH dehydrogenase 5B [Striga hermonthica]|uniref:NADH dehydrogenase 5B n=1 Tax=Striga hermonthica TaxID=68872 RepID=A0A9N7NLM5_STRHE|nr:NADH dehydrogenase 5B [Striga hermonthica]
MLCQMSKICEDGAFASLFLFTYAMMLVGSSSLIEFPLLTGFYSIGCGPDPWWGWGRRWVDGEKGSVLRLLVCGWLFGEEFGHLRYQVAACLSLWINSFLHFHNFHTTTPKVLSQFSSPTSDFGKRFEATHGPICCAKKAA